MPDITDQILAEVNPLYDPLVPTVGNIKDYAQELKEEIALLMKPVKGEISEYADDIDYYDHTITYEWATNEILNHQMGWVRAGLVADCVCRYRIYKHKFPDWKTYCKKVLGREAWKINRQIKAAKATLSLIQEGFDILPTCISHAQKLIDCCQKSGQLLIDAWYDVTNELPAPYLLTANRIGEALGFPAEKRKITLPSHLRDRLQDAAFNEGVTVEEKIERWLDADEGIEPEEEQLTEEEVNEKEQLWHQDVNELVKEHDQQIWLLTAISKMVQLASKKVSQFSYLRDCSRNQLRYQTAIE